MMEILTSIWAAIALIFSGTPPINQPQVDETLGAPSTSLIYQRTIIPESDNAYDLGTSTKRWRNIYCLTINGVACGTGGSGGAAGVSSTIWKQDNVFGTVYLTTSTLDVLIGGSTAIQANNMLGIIASSSQSIPLIIKATSSQAVDLFRIASTTGLLYIVDRYGGFSAMASSSIREHLNIYATTSQDIPPLRVYDSLAGLNFWVGATGSLYAKGTSTFDNTVRVNGRITSPYILSSMDLTTGVTPGSTDPDEIIVQGNYAYIVDIGLNTFSIIDIQDPRSLKGVTSTQDNGGLSSYLEDMKGLDVQGKYIYVISSSADNRLVIFDASYPKKLTVVGDIAISLGGTVGYLGDIEVLGQYAYVLGNNSGGTPVIEIYDVSDPTSPRRVSTWTSPFSGTTPTNIAISQNYLYFTETNGFTIVDIEDPKNPISIAGVSQSRDFFGSQNGEVRIVGNRMYTSDYVDAFNDLVRIYDISNRESPTQLSTIFVSTGNPMVIAGDYMYLGTDNDLNIYNVSSSTVPRLVKSVDLGAHTPYSMAMQGNYIFSVSQNDDTIVTIDVGGAQISNADIGGLKVGQLDVLGQARFDSEVIINSGAFVGGGLMINGDLSLFSVTSSLRNPTSTIRVNNNLQFIASSTNLPFLFQTTNTPSGGRFVEFKNFNTLLFGVPTTQLSDGCLNITSGLLGSTGAACGSGGGGSGSNWVFANLNITPSTTVGIMVNASSSFGAGLQVAGALNASSTLLIKNSLYLGQATGFSEGKFNVNSDGNVNASGTVSTTNSGLFGLGIITNASSSIESLNVSKNLNASGTIFTGGQVTQITGSLNFTMSATNANMTVTLTSGGSFTVLSGTSRVAASVPMMFGGVIDSGRSGCNFNASFTPDLIFCGSDTNSNLWVFGQIDDRAKTVTFPSDTESTVIFAANDLANSMTSPKFLSIKVNSSSTIAVSHGTLNFQTTSNTFRFFGTEPGNNTTTIIVSSTNPNSGTADVGATLSGKCFKRYVNDSFVEVIEPCGSQYSSPTTSIY